MSFFADYFEKIGSGLRAAAAADLDEFAARLAAVSAKGGKVVMVGNGGSAAMASHVTVDLTKTCGIRAVNFNEADLLTCFANDYGYENWVSEALKAYADPNDLVVLISSSGRSPNILNGARTARSMGLGIVTFSGFEPDNPLRQMGDLNFWVDNRSYNMVEMTHHVWLLAVVDKIAADRAA